MVTEELAELIGRSALGDRAAYRTLYERSAPKLFGVLLRILKSRAEAEEALQEVYVKVWQRAKSFRPGEASPMSWLIAIARNQAIDLLRARPRGTDDMDAAMEVPDQGPGPERNAMASDEARQLGDCLDRLDTDKAGAVRAAYMEGYSYDELAERYSVPLNTMRTWLRRSLMQLRDCLEK